MPEPPIACSWTPDQRAGRRDLLPALLSAATACHEIADGYRLNFESEDGLLSRIITVVEQERRCCRFLRFALSAEPDHGPVVLDVTGPSGSQDFLRDLLGA